jgi:hypothetical protein
MGDFPVTFLQTDRATSRSATDPTSVPDLVAGRTTAGGTIPANSFSSDKQHAK